MRLLQIQYKGFGPFKEKVTLDLDNQGVVLVTGPNGSGKSALISDGLVYGLYGQTLKGEQGADVINLYGDGQLFVAVDFLDDKDTMWRIERKRKGATQKLELFEISDGKANSRTMGTAKDTQAKIDEILGMDMVTFACSVVFGQGFVKPFAAMTDAEQKKVFGKIVDFESFQQWRDRAKDKCGDLETSTQDARFKAEKQKGLLENARIEQEEYETRKTEWEANQKKKIDTSKADLKKLKTSLKTYDNVEEKINSTKERIEERKQQLETAKKKVKLLDEKLEIAKKKAAEARDAVMESRTGINHLTSQAVSFEGLGDSCTTCHQTINKHHKKGQLLKLQADLKEAKVRLKVVEEIAKDEKAAAKKAQAKRDSASEKAAEATGLVYKAKVDLARHEERGKRAKEKKQEYKKLKDSLKALKVEKFAGGQVVGKNIPEYTKEIASLTSKIEDYQKQLPYFQFWLDAFGKSGLQSFILDSVTPYLTERANKYSQVITDGLIDIEFQTVNQLKNGKLKDNFKVLANVKNGSKTYKGASEGQKAKIDLCVGLALQDLVRSRSKTRVNVAILDEATAYLDLDSSEKFIELLQSNLVTAETVFVVSHDDIFKGYFEDEIKLTRENDNTTVEMWA